MTKLFLAILLTLGMAAPVFADGIKQVVSPTDINPQWMVTAFNDTGSTVTSRSVVSWDDDDTDFSVSLLPYFTTVTTADDPYIAGVTLTDCLDQQLCDIQVYGPAVVRVADATDNTAVDTLVSTSSVAGQAGDYGPAANTCALGTYIIDATALGSGGAADNTLGRVFINISCQ